ncbi:aminoglycoside phosphotransferase family protein [Ideonella sp. A 288]|uniref:aminoglycoside phosphotransferase family protein n=1 Tax=Ideonella sp. A 288 TaxID=1962181 RepID=UPI001F3D822B|nr:phosphotransferase [Ideonella sp. A 288]
MTTDRSIRWADAGREAAFEQWLAPLCTAHGLDRATLAPASADASFRRYFRIQGRSGPMIVMDAPPPQEDVRPFLDIGQRVRDAGLHAPEVFAADPAQGFLLLADLGSRLYLDELTQADAARGDRLMRDALAALAQWQRAGRTDGLPDYDEALLRREMALFPEWCVGREHGITWTDTQRAVWDRVTDALVRSALAQPQVAVHRDWMPRNLMVCEPNPGILDFQDAVRGPVTYDIASLLRDAFLSWDEEREIDWAARWWERARRDGLLQDHAMAEDFGEAWRALEWMGLQRHLKVAGIFCRLKHRDGKDRYAADLPRFFAYITKVALRYRQLQPLVALIEPMSGTLVTTGFSMR